MLPALRGDGSARWHAAFKDGVVLNEARRRKERTYPGVGTKKTPRDKKNDIWDNVLNDKRDKKT